MNKQLDILDIITILSFCIAIKNLEENEKQNNLLKRKLDNQDKEYLEKIILQNEEIIKLLKGGKI